MSEVQRDCVERLLAALEAVSLPPMAERARDRIVPASTRPVVAPDGVASTGTSTVAERWLLPALRGAPGQFAPLVASLTRAEPDLRWHYAYPPTQAVDDLHTRIGFCELIGPRGPFRSHVARLGLTLLAPRTAYPPHLHPAEEIYVFVSGTAQWIAGTEVGRRRPGDAIFHPSGVPHATNTDVEPMLAIYGWTGDVLTPSTYVTS